MGSEILILSFCTPARCSELSIENKYPLEDVVEAFIGIQVGP